MTKVPKRYLNQFNIRPDFLIRKLHPQTYFNQVFNMNKQHPILALAPLFLVILIDGMGLGLLFPILSNIIIEPSSTYLSKETSESFRCLLYGSIIGVFMVCWFFGAAMLGELSDIIGRKKSLLICLIGAFIGYLLSGIAITTGSISLLIFGRIIAGFTAGSQPIAQAAIVDISTPEHKARNIGLILFAVSVGFVLGPVLGGILSNSSFVHWFTCSTPLYFAALISLLNAFLLLFYFKETFLVTGKIKIKPSLAFTIFISAFKHEKIRHLSFALLIMIFGWSNLFTFISIFLIHHYHLQPFGVSMFLALGALGFGVGSGFLVDYVSNHFKLKTAAIVSFFITALGSLLIILIQNLIFTYINYFVIGIALAIGYSTLLTLFSNQVSDKEQGWVMGVSGSIMALCFGITSFLTGFLMQVGADFAIYLAVIGLGLSALILVFFKQSSNLPATN